MNETYKTTGQVVAVLTGADPDSLVTARQPQVVVNFSGLEGDKHSGFTRPSDGRTPYYPRGTGIRNDRQVSIVSVEELEQVAAALGLPEILPEWLGANLLLSGIPNLTQLPTRTRLVFSHGVVLSVTGENLPCTGPGKVLQDHYNQDGLATQFPQAAIQRRGLVAVVEKPGILWPGEQVEIERPALPQAPFLQDCLERLQFLYQEMSAALHGLPPEALDWTPGADAPEGLNSLGVLAVHVAGAQRYWLGDVLAGEPSGRERAAEFRARGFEAQALEELLDQALAYASGVHENLSLEDLQTERTSPRDGRKFTASWCILHNLEHVAIHLGHMQLMRSLWDQQVIQNE
ncbi:MAG: DinB family protein [Chloroflexota bacterium]